MEVSRIHLFQKYGIEIEYMIVDRDSLEIRSIADQLFEKELGKIEADVERGAVTWSNELVMHVVELKATSPITSLPGFAKQVSENVKHINGILAQWNACLMPTAAHPFMNPQTQPTLWPHDNSEVYELYNAIFNCKGHGWSNLQSTHLNLPFYDDEEFAKLHAAVRLVLPILPALCASSPILDGQFTGTMDMRLRYYKDNQKRILSITGKVIPEAIFSKRNYLKVIYDKIKEDLKTHDRENILNPIWVNSRGAIPRFDRGSIEIRIMDSQECPHADMAIQVMVIELIKVLVRGEWIAHDEQLKWRTDDLVDVYNDVCKKADAAVIANTAYLEIFGYEGKSTKALDLWKHIAYRLGSVNPEVMKAWQDEFGVILNQGCLAKRIMHQLQALGGVHHENIVKVYKELCVCLEQNKMFSTLN
jgi:gamma-glutamyl:cysteine ligase YbdK (ATP-grasp superfamily)